MARLHPTHVALSALLALSGLVHLAGPGVAPPVRSADGQGADPLEGPRCPPVPDGPASTSDDLVRRLAADHRSWGPLEERPAPRVVHCGAAVEGADAPVLGAWYARDPAAYRGIESGAPQRAQAVVIALQAGVPYRQGGPGRLPESVVRTDDGYFRAGGPLGLLVVGRNDARSELVFGRVDAQGAVVAAGRPDGCVGCHGAAPYDELFGLEARR